MSPSARGQALTVRAAAWYATLSPRRRELVQDGTLAVALGVLNLLTLLPYQSRLHPLWLAYFLVCVQCLPLTIRRVNPVLALILCGVPRDTYDALQFGYAPLPLAIAIAFATVAERSRPWLRWGTLACTAVGITVSQSLPGHNEPYDAIIQYFIFGAAWVVGTLARSQRAAFTAAARRAERAEAELDALAAKASAAAAAERVRIARELHDVVAHHVSLIAVQAEAVGALLPARPEHASRTADLIANTARQAMTELRRLLGVLRAPSDGDPPNYPERTELSPAASLSRIDEVLAQVRGAGVAVSLTVSGAPAELSPGIDLTAYRIVQEALTNTIRHAPPGAQAHVDISYEDGSVTVRVTDTGAHGAKPLSPAAVPVPRSRLDPGFGLAGIAERVSSCGGTLTVGPLNGGFSVSARLPVH